MDEMEMMVKVDAYGEAHISSTRKIGDYNPFGSNKPERAGVEGAKGGIGEKDGAARGFAGLSTRGPI